MLKIIGAIILSIIALFLTGIVVSDLWLWFITPIGISSISKVQAIGISLLVNLLTFKPNMAINDELKGYMAVTATIIATLIIWGMGAITHIFM